MEAAFFDDHHPYEIHETADGNHAIESGVFSEKDTEGNQESLDLAQRITEQQERVQKTAYDLELAQDHLVELLARINRGEPVSEDEIGHANHEVDRLFAKEAEARRKLHKLEGEFSALDTDSQSDTAFH